MIRTSYTDPLRIAEIAAEPYFGRIGITLCPGKYDLEGGSGCWDRDLDVDLDEIQRWGAAAVITLLESDEMDLLKVGHLGEEVQKRGIRWFHLPIKDRYIPDELFETEWIIAGEAIRSLLIEGKDILLHCRGGVGRAGTIAARILVELGMEAPEAIELVRRRRSRNALETPEQEKFVLNLRAKADG